MKGIVLAGGSGIRFYSQLKQLVRDTEWDN